MKDRIGAYYTVRHCRSLVFIPMKNVESLRIEKGEGDSWSVVFITLSGKEYTRPGFNTFREAQTHCEFLMGDLECQGFLSA